MSKTGKCWVETEVTMGSLKCNPGDMGAGPNLKDSWLTRSLSTSQLGDLIWNLGVQNVHWDLDSSRNSGQK